MTPPEINKYISPFLIEGKDENENADYLKVGGGNEEYEQYTKDGQQKSKDGVHRYTAFSTAFSTHLHKF